MYIGILSYVSKYLVGDCHISFRMISLLLFPPSSIIFFLNGSFCALGSLNLSSPFFKSVWIKCTIVVLGSRKENRERIPTMHTFFQDDCGSVTLSILKAFIFVCLPSKMSIFFFLYWSSKCIVAVRLLKLNKVVKLLNS